jgi:hypothetical protein
MIPTPKSVQQTNRQLDRRRADVFRVLRLMHSGNLTLHLQYIKGRAVWSLTDGTAITAQLAELVIQRPEVVPVGDALFEDAPPQTYCLAPRGTRKA